MMKALTLVSLLGMLALALCEKDLSDLDGAGPMPPDSAEITPPGIGDSDDRPITTNNKRSQELDLSVRHPVKNVQQRRAPGEDESDEDSDADNNLRHPQDWDLSLRDLVKSIVDQQRRGNVPSKRADRRSKEQRRGQKQRKQDQRDRDQRNVIEAQVTSMTAAKNLVMTGEETPTQATQQEVQDTVNVHQMFRKMEDASDIWKIDWDDSLARLSQSLADKCVFKHTNLYFANKTRVGQNLAILKGSNHSIEKVVQLFYNEKSAYYHAGNSYDDYNLVGHYLQLVYWDTVKVGCGVRFCPTLYLPDSGDVWNDAWYWACDYWPPLHMKTRPYHVGNPCSECVVPAGKGIGWKCADNTCEDCNIGEAGCNTPGPCTTFEPDIKSAALCAKVKKFKYCERGSSGYKFAKLYCKTTCQFCRGIPESMDTRK